MAGIFTFCNFEGLIKRLTNSKDLELISNDRLTNSRKLMKRFFATILTLLICSLGFADAIQDLQTRLTKSTQVQEKIYLHTDNSCYFVGDTLWYKAYVTHATSLKPTQLSRLLYVELLTPDGYLVERQHVEIDQNGGAHGQFILFDSIYSGYYELRAYTRWQLNFNEVKKNYTRDDKLRFFPNSAAADFYRQFEGLYSRVLPIYEKPKKAGDYTDRYMSHRPKQRLMKSKEGLQIHFYPEGGQPIEGLQGRVAYELTDLNGQAMDIEGVLTDGTKLKSQHLGRGTFMYTPNGKSAKATFTQDGKTYTFTLPKAQDAGIGLYLNTEKASVTVKSRNVTAAAYAIMCRGRLVKFERLTGDGEIKNIKDGCPTGINEIIVYDADATPRASRLFFVNNHDTGTEVNVTMAADGQDVNSKTTLAAYAPVKMTVDTRNVPGMSVAVRDAQTDERGYDNGNMLTDMLLSSELKGFIATPGYYFAADDEQHRADLDLLMMVQGWRRYKHVSKFRYMPERELTFEGTVYTLPENVGLIELEDVEKVLNKSTTVYDMMLSDTGVSSISSTESSDSEDSDSESTIDADSESTTDTETTSNENTLATGKAIRNVYVEAEIVKGTDVAGAAAKTGKAGHFIINLPTFYDKAFLFVKAYTRRDSLNKCLTNAAKDKDRLNERSYPDFFVKRDMFFPVYSQPYSWYQINSPELNFIDEEEDGTIPATSRLAGNHVLQNVIVKAKRRGKRGIDMNKPAMVYDAYDLYNDATDYGLLWGVADFRRMPVAFATTLFGNMGRTYDINVRALVNGTTFYRNYTPMASEYDKPAAATNIFNQLKLSNIKNIRVFSDYELRTDSGYVADRYNADVTLDFQTMPDDAKRATYRDRRYVIDGLAFAEEFYSPDYSALKPAEPTDYRRTLYWNPDVKPDQNGQFQTTFYNNCRETRVTVSVAGVDSQGQIYYK